LIVANIGIVSMGNMGLTIAASMINSGNKIHWTSEDRSEKTKQNGRNLEGSIEHQSMKELFNSSDIIFCIGRLGAGIDTINSAADNQFDGIYVDGNNLSGESSEKEISEIAKSADIKYVEALFRGYPIGYDQGGGEDKRDLYLSGQSEFVKVIESLFSDGIWKVHIVQESAKELNRTRFKRLF
jgi:3-hydroxyisobutyrate dehydrogenase-like beta-hydroxyacid dehydrogenase